VVWSGALRSTSIKDRTDRRKPSAWRSGNPKTSRSVNAVSIARSENFLCAPRRPDGAGVHASVASSESQRVMSPRWTSARSYSGQFPTRYVVLAIVAATSVLAHTVPARRAASVNPVVALRTE